MPLPLYGGRLSLGEIMGTKSAASVEGPPAGPVGTDPPGLPSDLVARATRKDQVYLALRQALMYGRFAPGTTVTVRSLSERFEAGIMPVRDAVQRLVAERALLFLPNGRLRVPLLEAAELADLFELRLLLECHAARRATAHASAGAIADIRAAALRLENDRHVCGTGTELLAANFRFHFALYAAAGSAPLVTMIEGLWLRFGPLLIDLINRPGVDAYLEDEHALHNRLVSAIELRDAEFAASAMRAIIERTREALNAA